MRNLQTQPESKALDRRRFCAISGVAALAAMAGVRANAGSHMASKSATFERIQTGNGEWTYDVVLGWSQLPAGKSFGGTHGAIATDKAGHVYVSTQSETGVLVFSPDGALQKTIANQCPEVHSMFYAQEGADEYLYTTVQKGTPQENWLFVKMKIDGSVVPKITAPPEAGFRAPNEWRITAAVPAPDGSIFIANGYGDSRIFRFEKMARTVEAMAAKESRMAFSTAAMACP
jgi:hypothetical protein